MYGVGISYTTDSWRVVREKLPDLKVCLKVEKSLFYVTHIDLVMLPFIPINEIRFYDIRRVQHVVSLVNR